MAMILGCKVRLEIRSGEWTSNESAPAFLPTKWNNGISSGLAAAPAVNVHGATASREVFGICEIDACQLKSVGVVQSKIPKVRGNNLPQLFRIELDPGSQLAPRQMRPLPVPAASGRWLEAIERVLVGKPVFEVEAGGELVVAERVDLTHTR